MKASDWKNYYLKENTVKFVTPDNQVTECELKQNADIGVNCDITDENKDQAVIILRLMAELPQLFNDIKIHNLGDDYQQMLAIGSNIKEIAAAAKEVLVAKI